MSGAERDPPRTTILLVEDDRVHSALYQRVLERPEWHVLVAETLAEADALLREHRIALVVLDLFLPDGDSRSWLGRVREEAAFTRLPVIVVAASAVTDAQIDFYALGAGPVLEKPVRPAMLVAAVSGALRREGEVVPPAPAAPPVDPPSESRNRGRLLLVEDDEVTAALVRHRLAREGFEVVRVATGPEALDAADCGGLALIVLDIMLPGLDGFELLTRLRRHPASAHVPIVMLTGLGNERDVERALALGANDYVMKPFSPVELVARVNRLTRRS